MRKEIDILRKALDSDCALVEKVTNSVWSEEEIERASTSNRFQQEDALLAPDNLVAVSSLFPGCPQQFGANPSVFHYAPVGQTANNVIFHTRNKLPISIAERFCRDGVTGRNKVGQDH